MDRGAWWATIHENSESDVIVTKQQQQTNVVTESTVPR